MAKKKKKRGDKQIEEWNKQVRALGEKNRNKLMKAMRNNNA